MSDNRRDNSRHIRARRGSEIKARSWTTEAAVRMLMNNLDDEVAEDPQSLVVYGGIGRAARNWQCYDKIVETLERLEEDQSLLVQSGKPVGVFRTHEDAPRVLIANSNLVPKWATWEHFHELDRKGLMMYGQMTAGSWIYIGTQGIVQGTYETFVEMGRQHYGGDLKGRWILTACFDGKPFLSGLTLQRSPHAPRGIRMPNFQASFFLPDSLRYDRTALGAATLTVSVVLQASGERAAVVDVAATFTDDPSGTSTWIQVHVSGHLGWPAGVSYRVIAVTPPDAVR